MTTKTLLPLLALVLTGCASAGQSAKEKDKMELAMHKLLTDVDEIKHDLNTHEIEYHILQGKFSEQENALQTLKKETLLAQKEQFDEVLEGLNTQITALANEQRSLLSELQQIQVGAKDTTVALTRYKEKIDLLEKDLLEQTSKLVALSKEHHKAEPITVSDTKENASESVLLAETQE